MPATTEIYTLSLHDALPISAGRRGSSSPGRATTKPEAGAPPLQPIPADRKSTRLNSSHRCISYAVFCLKKKKKKKVTKHIYELAIRANHDWDEFLCNYCTIS